MAEAEFAGDEFFGDPAPQAIAPQEDTGEVQASSTDQAQAADTTSEPSTEAASADPAAQPQSALGLDVDEALSRERLPRVEGETREAALIRLYNHQRGKADRLYHEELRKSREAHSTAQDELRQFKEEMRPLLVALRERDALAQREQAMAAIPDKEADPEGYRTWLIEEQFRRQVAQEQAQAEAYEQAQQRAIEEERLGEVLSIDEAAFNELEQAVATDPEVQAGWNFAVAYATRMAETQWPTAPPEKIQELVSYSMQLNMRNAVRAGVGVAALYKSGLENARHLIASVSGNGAATNGHTNGAKPQAPAAPAATNKDKLVQAQAKAKAKATVSPVPAPRSTPNGQGTDWSQMSEEEYLEVALSSPQALREYNAWLQTAHGKTTYR